MELTPYVDELREQLAVAAEAAGEDARALAERLTSPLESAVRLTLLNVLSAAMDEVTRDLAPGSVEVRLRGLDPSFVVTPPPGDESAAAMGGGDAAMAPSGATMAAGASTAVPAGADADEGGTARVNLRLPSQLKLRVEEAAAGAGVSVNTWLVRTATAALTADDRGRRPPRRGGHGGQHFTGWVH